jgi:hypothetical protein
MPLTKMAQLERKVIEQHEEIARLKGRLDLKPSDMDPAAGPTMSTGPKKPPHRGKIRPEVCVEDRIFPAPVPPGSPFKDHETYTAPALVRA